VSGLKKSKPIPEYLRLLAEVKERVRSAQYAALKTVNTEPVERCSDPLAREFYILNSGDKSGCL